MAYRNPEVGRAKGRERSRRRVERRTAAGLCPRCGDRPPAPERSVCRLCAEKVQPRVPAPRDARLRAAGKPRRDSARAREYERERARRETAKRAVRGNCTRCGKHPAMPGRKSCEPCLEKGAPGGPAARYAAGKAAGLKYGGADPEVKRRAGRDKSKRRQQERIEAGLCIRCGTRPPADGGTTCQPCRDKRQAAERRKYTERRAAGCCTRCGGPAHDGLTRCAPCSAIEQASRRPDREKTHAAENCMPRGEPAAFARRAEPPPGALPAARPAPSGATTARPTSGGIPVWDPALDGDRAGNRPRARAVRRSGRRGALPRLREARPRPRRGAVRRARHRLAHRLDLNPAAQAGPPPARGTCRRPGARIPRPGSRGTSDRSSSQEKIEQ